MYCCFFFVVDDEGVFYGIEGYFGVLCVDEVCGGLVFVIDLFIDRFVLYVVVDVDVIGLFEV